MKDEIQDSIIIAKVKKELEPIAEDMKKSYPGYNFRIIVETNNRFTIITFRIEDSESYCNLYKDYRFMLSRCGSKSDLIEDNIKIEFFANYIDKIKKTNRELDLWYQNLQTASNEFFLKYYRKLCTLLLDYGG